MPCLCESIVCVPLQILSEGLSMLPLACCCRHKSVVRSELSYLFAAICTEFTMYESVGNKVSLPNVFICQIFSFPFYRRTISTKEKASVNRRGRDKTAKYPNKRFTVMPHDVTCQFANTVFKVHEGHCCHYNELPTYKSVVFVLIVANLQ